MTGCLENTRTKFHFSLKIKHCKPQNKASQTLIKLWTCIHIKTKELEITLSPLELTLKIKSYFIVLKGLLKEFDIFCSAIIRQNLSFWRITRLLTNWREIDQRITRLLTNWREIDQRILRESQRLAPNSHVCLYKLQNTN